MALLKSFEWQLRQAVLVRLKLLLRWHAPHCCVPWTPTSAKPVVAWLKVAPSQLMVVWHPAQSCGKLPALCGGLLVLLKSVMWQPMHAVLVKLKLPLV